VGLERGEDLVGGCGPHRGGFSIQVAGSAHVDGLPDAQQRASVRFQSDSQGSFILDAYFSSSVRSPCRLMPGKQAPEPSLRSWIGPWLRLLSPTDPRFGLVGRLITGLRLFATADVVLAFVVTVWATVALILCGAWQLLHQGRLGSALFSLLGGIAAAVDASCYRRWRNRRSRT
jgi:hypothetical protein